MNLNEIKLVPLLDTLKLQKIDDSEYFSKKYNGYISNSRLSLINPEQDGSPEKFFEGFKPIYNASFDLGSYTHALVLQNDLFYLVDSVDKPTAKLGALADRLYGFYITGKVTPEDITRQSAIIDYYGGNLNQKKIDKVYENCTPYWESRAKFESTYSGDKELLYSDKKTRETVWNCVRALNENEHIQKLLHPIGLIENPISENEQAILLDIEVHIPKCNPFILKLKAKLDNYTIDTESNTLVVNDVKTIGKILSEFQYNFEKFHYSRELAIYSWLIGLVARKYYNMDNCTITSNCLVVSTIPNYYTKVYPLSKRDFSAGWEEFKYLLRIVAYYYNKGYRFS